MRGLAGTQACINFCCGYSVFLDAHLRMIINAGTLAEHPDLPAGADITRHRARDAGQPAGGAGTQGPRGPRAPAPPHLRPSPPARSTPAPTSPSSFQTGGLANTGSQASVATKSGPGKDARVGWHWDWCTRSHPRPFLTTHRGAAPPLLPPAIPLSGTGQLLVPSSRGSGSASVGRHVGNGFMWH